MGIRGFLRKTRVERRRHLSDYKNQTAAIDAYSWLHKALYTCGEELMSANDITGIYNYFVPRIKYMLDLGMKLVFVFDGDDISLKSRTNEDRAANREKMREKYQRCMAAGKTQEARRYFSSAIDVTPEMAYAVKCRLQADFPYNVEFMVAPYEADSQMAYLSRIGYVHLVISEDSDLLIFGAKKVFYKMDNEFTGDEVELSALANCQEFNFREWTHDQIISFAVLCGCDYLDSPRGMAFVNCYKIYSKTRSVEDFMREMRGKLEDNYYERFICAYLSFKYQNVWCPLAQRLTTLQPFQSHDAEYKKKALEYFASYRFLGGMIETDVVKKLVAFEIDPKTRNPFPIIPKFVIQIHKGKGRSKRTMPNPIKRSVKKRASRLSSNKKDSEKRKINLDGLGFFADFEKNSTPFGRTLAISGRRDSQEPPKPKDPPNDIEMEIWKSFGKKYRPKNDILPQKDFFRGNDMFKNLGFADEVDNQKSDQQRPVTSQTQTTLTSTSAEAPKAPSDSIKSHLHRFRLQPPQ